MADVVWGDLLDQEVDALVNAWNRNLIPWWLLLPQGVSGAIKRRAGLEPSANWRGTARSHSAARCSPGRHRAIIHVAGINGFWRASEYSIRESVRNATALAAQQGFASLAFPVIGAGSGGFDEARALEVMLAELAGAPTSLSVRVVRFTRR
jgi:O-acetyl-ADP-ribose deacetylase (regulator of RNase III)